MKKMLSWCCAWAVIFTSPLINLAMAESKPVASIGLSGYGEILGDADFIGKLFGQPNVSTQIEMVAAMTTQGALAQTLDRAKPWGASVSTDGISFTTLVFLPVSDAKKLLAPLAAAGISPKEAGDGVLEVSTPQLPMPLYVKQQGSWTYISQSLSDVGSAPADPISLLGGLEKKYDISVRLHPQNVPQTYRDMILDQIKSGMDAANASAGSHDELEKRMQANSFNQLKQFFGECAELTVGVSVDQKAKNMVLESSVVAASGTHLAEQCAGIKDAKSSFGGFVINSAAVNFSAAQSIGKQDIQEMKDSIAALKVQLEKKLDSDVPDAAAKKTLKEVAADVFKSLESTVATGKFDASGSLLLEGKNVGVVAAARMADTKSLDSAIKRLIELGQKDGELKDAKLDAETVGNVRFHKIMVPVPPEAAPVLGAQYELAIGIGPDVAYLATGPDGMNQFKKATSSAVKSSDASNQLSISLAKIAAFASGIMPDPKAAAFATALAKQPGKDHITVKATALKNGVNYRLEVEPGVLEAVGQLSPGQARGK